MEDVEKVIVNADVVNGEAQPEFVKADKKKAKKKSTKSSKKDDKAEDEVANS